MAHLFTVPVALLFKHKKTYLRKIYVKILNYIGTKKRGERERKLHDIDTHTITNNKTIWQKKIIYYVQL